MVANGIIRKISVGDLKNGITYIVGQYMMQGRTEITEIRLDIPGSLERGCAKYDILVRQVGNEFSRMWKSVEGMSVVVEYELDTEEYVEA